MSFGPPRCRWAGIESRTRKLYGALVGPLLADSCLSVHLGDDGTDLTNSRIAMCEFCTMLIDPSSRLVDSGARS